MRGNNGWEDLRKNGRESRKRGRKNEVEGLMKGVYGICIEIELEFGVFMWGDEK